MNRVALAYIDGLIAGNLERVSVTQLKTCSASQRCPEKERRTEELSAAR